MSNADDYAVSTGQLLGMAAFIIAGVAVKLTLFKMADHGRKQRIAELEKQFSLPSYRRV